MPHPIDEALKKRYDEAREEEKRRRVRRGLGGGNHTTFESMVAQHGAYETAIRLISAGIEQSGLNDLFLANCADLSVEAIILEPPFIDAFPSDIVAEAKRRLGK